MSRTIESMLSLPEARSRILDHAEPGEPIEASLVDALGLVLAGPAEADVHLPPFDRATREGYAVRAAEATPGALLRVIGTRRIKAADEAIEAGEASRVAAGAPMPAGADAVARLRDVRPDPESGRTRVIEVLRGAGPGRGVSPRGSILEAGREILPAGTRLRAPMVGLLASQGCVHPLCHRRVRVAILAVGDHLVPPAEAPTMHRERNAANLALAALAVRADALPHDFQAVPARQLLPALERSTSSPVILVLGDAWPAIPRAFRALGVEPIFRGVAARPGGGAHYGVIRDDEGRVAHHVFRLPGSPVEAAVAFTLLVRPLIRRLQGDPDPSPTGPAAHLDGDHRASGRWARALPAAFRVDADARCRVRPIPTRGPDDLPALALADGLAVLPPDSGPWSGGETVEYAAFDA